jgi:3-dehydroquinate synthase
VPTSLLAMVDASVGGKTGVNHPQGKNLIGAFYQPKLVVIDPLLLKTLPEREFRAGMAEVIKYGVIGYENEDKNEDKNEDEKQKLFRDLESAKNLDSLDNFDPELLNFILIRSCEIKAKIVSKDEKESGLRAILNYGHTVGHAIESLTNYTTFVHGEAVAIGMVVAGKIAVKQQLWTELEAKRQEELIKKAGLPTKIPNYLDIEKIIEELKKDKKVIDGKAPFILPTTIGKVIITGKKNEIKITPELLREILPICKE